MISRKLFRFFGLIIVLFSFNQIKAQSNIAIVLNEYSATNVNGLTNSAADIYGHTTDWVELYCDHTSQVSLKNYYLSNDRKNLFKWQFPSDYTIDPKGYAVVWLSGKSGPKGVKKSGETHANFTLEQCKGQWLILSTDQGVVRDSVYVQRAKAGHTWGRYGDNTIMGINAWRLFTEASQLQANPLVYSHLGYVPTPKCFVSTTTNFKGPNTGGFFNDGAQIAYFRLADTGPAFDTTYSCYQIWYTTNGDYPDPSNAQTTTLYTDSLEDFITIDQTKVIRAIAILDPNDIVGCPTGYLPSFCESNTYFIEPEYQDFNTNFGVLSISMDTSWFGGSGSTSTVHIEYYDKKQQVSEGYGVINRPVNEAWITKQKGFHVTIDDERGSGCNFEGPIFNVDGLGTTPRNIFPTLHVSAGDYESHSAVLNQASANSFGTGIRDVFYQSLAAKYNLNVSPLHIKPTVLFMNGRYMGVYNLREVFDKHYEAFYNKQSRDSLDMHYMHLAEGNITDHEGTPSTFGASFRAEVYDPIINGIMNNKTQYDKVMAKLDKASFIDYMILNSYAMNSDLFDFNVAFAKGSDPTKAGGKWHYSLWNMPSIFNFTAVSAYTGAYNNPGISPCIFISQPMKTVLQRAFNGHGNMLKKLMTTTDNAGQSAAKFQLEYKNRYQDLLNGPLSCTNMKKHFDFIKNLYLKEYKYHEDPGSPPKPGAFASTIDLWDSSATRLGRLIEQRCYVVENYFDTPGCYFGTGPHQITVDVFPAGAGKVKLNTTVLEGYKWTGRYYGTLMSFKAIPTNTTYAFHHWEFEKHIPTRPASMDSVAINLYTMDNVRAVFTDKATDIIGTGEGANVPTGFTPNGDGYNDEFKPVGAGEYAMDYQMTIWNRWGEEVFRSVSPQTGWDGNFKGQQAITGVYAYIISYKNIFGESKLVKGNVTLTR